MNDIKVTTALFSDSAGKRVTIRLDSPIEHAEVCVDRCKTFADAAELALAEFERPVKAVRDALIANGVLPDKTGSSLPSERERAPQTLLDILRASVHKYRGQLDAVGTELNVVCKDNVATVQLAHIVANDLRQTRNELEAETRSLEQTVTAMRRVIPNWVAPPAVIATKLVDELLATRRANQGMRDDLNSQKAECARLAALNKEDVALVDHARTRAADAERSLRNTLEALRSVYPTATGGIVEDVARSCVAELKLARQSVKDLSAVRTALAELAPPGTEFVTIEQAQYVLKELIYARAADMQRQATDQERVAHQATIRTYEEQVTSLRNALRNAITSHELTRVEYQKLADVLTNREAASDLVDVGETLRPLFPNTSPLPGALTLARACAGEIKSLREKLRTAYEERALGNELTNQLHAECAAHQATKDQYARERGGGGGSGNVLFVTYGGQGHGHGG